MRDARQEFLELLDFYQRDDVRSLDLLWVDPSDSSAGGELTVLTLTAREPQARVLIQNAAVAIGRMMDHLIWLHEYDENAQSTQRALLWQALRDYKGSLFLACAGRYRQAQMVRRTALEVAVAGTCFEGNWEKMATWLYEADGYPGWRQFQKAIQDTFPSMAPDVFDTILSPERYKALSKIIHTIRAGDVERSILRGYSLHPWSSAFELDSLLQWYIGLIKDLLFIGWVIIELWPEEHLDEYVIDIPDLLADIVNGQIFDPYFDSDAVVDVPEKWDVAEM